MCIIELYLTEAQTPEYPGDVTLKKKKNPNTLLQREKSHLIQGENWDLEIWFIFPLQVLWLKWVIYSTKFSSLCCCFQLPVLLLYSLFILLIFPCFLYASPRLEGISFTCMIVLDNTQSLFDYFKIIVALSQSFHWRILTENH